MPEKINEKPENMDDIFSKENLEFVCQYKMRSSILRVLKQNFDVKEMLVISEKKHEDKKDTEA